MFVQRRRVAGFVAAAGIAFALSVSAGPAAMAAPARNLLKPAPVWTEITGPSVSVNGTYTPIVGSFSDAAAADSIIWYAPGSGVDHFWRNDGNGTFTRQILSKQINGTYTPIVGDFGGDSRDDILFYSPGTAPDSLWLSTGTNAFTSQTERIDGTYRPVVVDNQTSRDQLIWQKIEGAGSVLWKFNATGSHTSQGITVPAHTSAVVGRFHVSAGCADIIWYGVGPAADAYWKFDCEGAWTASPINIKGTYTPVVGQFTPALRASEVETQDILWFRSGSTGSPLWQTVGNGTWTHSTHVIPYDGIPISVAAPWSLVHIWSPGGTDYAWTTRFGGIDFYLPTQSTPIPAGAKPLVLAGHRGADDTSGGAIFWYRPGTAPEYYFALNPATVLS